ncbi:hypothetical protein HZH68_001614 [Vespula germanica]|uniref:Vein beta-barrel domain-containing protein n=1 Tax=Vespula germanica TaxID=30212 RepID=A0A834NVT5_VESGE|nr:hypothetical protein HZH68_001614 [Vespula germanica]
MSIPSTDGNRKRGEDMEEDDTKRDDCEGDDDNDDGDDKDDYDEDDDDDDDDDEDETTANLFGGRVDVLLLLLSVVQRVVNDQDRQAARTMWASLLLAGFLSGWWGAFALAAAPPANRNTLEESAKHREASRTTALDTALQPILHPQTNSRIDASPLTRRPRHSSSQEASPREISSKAAAEAATAYYPYREEVPTANDGRFSRSTKQRGKNRGRADSPREQRRGCKIKGTCRGQNWCPDMDVGNRAYLAPTVFEGKARSMSSVRKPGSNYAVTFEVKHVYKSQPGFPPLQKNDSVRLHFRDKSAPGKSTVCGYEGYDNNAAGKQQQRGGGGGGGGGGAGGDQSGVVRANIKRGKVYLVFVNRVGPRNFTILGEPVIRSKKNEQAVQAVVRPDYEHGIPDCSYKGGERGGGGGWREEKEEEEEEEEGVERKEGRGCRSRWLVIAKAAEYESRARTALCPYSEGEAAGTLYIPCGA